MSRLSEILTRENAQLTSFLRILEREHVALKNQATDQLDLINQEKLQAIAQLNSIGMERSSLIDLHGKAQNQQTMQSWFINNPAESKSMTLWNELISLAKAARNLHEANSALVNIFLKNTKDALDILMRPRQDQTLYGSDGQATGKTGSRIIDSA